MLMIHLSYLIEQRFLSLPLNEDEAETDEPLVQQQHDNKIHVSKLISLPKAILFTIVHNFTFIILIVTSLLSIVDFYHCYSLVAVIISPFKTWSLIAAFYLRYECSRLDLADFSKFLDMAHLKNQAKPVGEVTRAARKESRT
jgi:hypothetical protein